MLALSRPRRQILATLALLLFTVAPTLYISHQVWRLRRPEHIREVERELGRVLGLKVTIEGVRHPRPGEDVLTGVSLTPEGQKGNRRDLARAEVVRLRREGKEVTVEAQGVTIAADAPSQAVAFASALLDRGGSSGYEAMGFSVDACDLSFGGGLRYRVRNIAGRLANAPTPVLTVSYRVPGDGPAPRCEMTVGRERAASGVRTLLTLRTTEGPLPARVLDPFFSTAGWLGTSALVDGTIALRQASSASQWEARFEGSLLDVDLATLVGQQFPDHRLSGRARLKVDAARWEELPGGKQGYGWVEAKGTLAAGQGAISPSLLSALAGELKFRVPRRPAPDGPDLEFHNLGMSFALNRDGEILFGGDLGPEFAPGAILARGDRTAPLASAPEGAASVVGLRKAMVPVASAELLMPARPESEFLRHLPLPPSGPTGALKAN